MLSLRKEYLPLKARGTVVIVPRTLQKTEEKKRAGLYPFVPQGKLKKSMSLSIGLLVPVHRTAALVHRTASLVVQFGSLHIRN